MQNAEIGHFSVDIKEHHFNLIPSFRNMSKLANSKDILMIYRVMHSPATMQKTLIQLSKDILLACVDNHNEFEKYLSGIGESGKPHIRLNSISINDQIIVAAALIRHGVAGVNRPKYAGSGKKSRPIEELDFNKMTADAMIHFGLSRNEAQDLTMSEFYHLLAAKYPQESKSDDAPSLEDHKAVMKELMEQNNG